MGEHIKGMFYAQELQKVTPLLLHQIAKILHSQFDADRKVRYYVSWRGYPEKFNS